MNEWIPGLPGMIGNYEFAIKGIDYPVSAYLGKIADKHGTRMFIETSTNHLRLDRGCENCTVENDFQLIDITHYREASKMP